MLHDWECKSKSSEGLTTWGCIYHRVCGTGDDGTTARVTPLSEQLVSCADSWTIARGQAAVSPCCPRDHRRLGQVCCWQWLLLAEGQPCGELLLTRRSLLMSDDVQVIRAILCNLSS